MHTALREKEMMLANQAHKCDMNNKPADSDNGLPSKAANGGGFIHPQSVIRGGISVL